MPHSNAYIFGFATAVCVVCSIFVAGSAVALKDRQEANKILDKQKNVLSVSGHMPDDPTADAVRAAYDKYIQPEVIELDSGKAVEGVDTQTFDQRKVRDDPDSSERAPANPAKILRVPDQGMVFKVVDGDNVEMVILPIEGKGLWSTLYGFLALAPDGTTIKGLTFYEHAETPGLGGEVDNARWKALWPGRKAFDEQGEIAIEVVKGAAGPADAEPYKVDGLSGATITSRGVTYALEFWLGDEGWGPYLDRVRTGGA